MVGHAVKRRVVMAVVFLGVLPLPILAYALGAYVVTRGSAGASAQHLLSSRLLLLLIALLVVSVGGFLIRRTATSLGRTMEVDDPLEAPAERLEQSGPVTNSVTRMLATIEQQADEISHFADRLDRAGRELDSAHARVQEVSFTDEVTRLYNRRFFSVRLEEEVARHRRFGHPLSLVLFDLDGFKAINEEQGRPAGDETLRAVAEVLVKLSRGIDVICRYGDDAFALLLVETPPAGARPYAERIRRILSTCSLGQGQSVRAGFGVASLCEDARSGDDLVRAAEDALHAAKRAGSNCVVVWEEPGVAHGAAPEGAAR